MFPAGILGHPLLGQKDAPPSKSDSSWAVRGERPRQDHRGIDLISDALRFGRLWYDTPDNAIGYSMHSSRSYDAVIPVYDDAGNVVETHEHRADFKECS